MRSNLNLSLRTLDKFSLLLHGGPGTGKTHLMGDALAYEPGLVAYINVAGQDGWLSLAEYDLGDIHSETVETLEDFLACMQDLTAMGLQMCALDSVRDLFRLCVINTTGLDRPPKAGAQNNEYTQIYFDFEKSLRVFKDCARRVITCSTSDRSTDQLSSQVNVVPDLPGRWGNGIAGLFDFVGYIHASTVMGKIRRNLSFQPMTLSVSNTNSINILTRQRLAHAIAKDIEIPAGPGGWEQVLKTFESHLTGEVQEELPTKKWKKG